MSEENKLQNSTQPPAETPSEPKTTEKIVQEKIQPQEQGPLKSLRTYQGDIEETLTKKRLSITSVFSAEQKRKESGVFEEPKEPFFVMVKNRYFVVTGIILFIIGIGAVITVYMLKSRTIAVVASQDTFISYSTEKPILVASSTRENILNSINTEKQSFTEPINSVLYLNMLKSKDIPMDIQTLMTSIFPSIPQSLVRSFDTKYMFGIYSFDFNASFIILTTTDYGTSYAGMLKWESTMPSDLKEIFNIPIRTSTSTRYIFEDESIRNKDLRIIKDENRKTILLYSFIDQNTLVITQNEEVFNAINGKYITNKQAR